MERYLYALGIVVDDEPDSTPLREIRRQQMSMTATRPTTHVKAKIESVMVGPDLAATIMEGNEGNRPIRDTRVEAYARAMKQGDWTLSDSMICVSKEGKLLNGQHRLKAVIDSGCTVPLTIYWDCPETAYAHMDAGAKRSAADYLGHLGVTNTTNIAALVRIIIAYRATGRYSPSMEVSPSFDDIYTTYSQDPDGFQQATQLSRVGKHLFSMTALGAVAYLAADKYPYKKVDAFFNELKVDAVGDLPKHDPRRTLIEYAIKHKMRHRTSIPFEIQTNMIAKAFLRFAQDRTVEVIVWREEEKTIKL